MKFALRNGILVPERPLQTILVFIDETILQDRSGFLQAALPIPDDIYDQVVVPKAKELLHSLGRNAKELKGSALKPGNRKVYSEFLELCCRVSSQIAAQAPLHPLISVDGRDIYAGAAFEIVRGSILGVFDRLGIDDEKTRRIACEFSSQMLWLYTHLPQIMPQGCKNEVVLVFDAKYLHAEHSTRKRFVTVKPGEAVAVELERVLSICARSLLRDNTSDFRIDVPINIRKVQFRRSVEEPGLQAADILCHLIYSILRHAKGISASNVAVKRSLLEEFVPEFEPEEELLANLRVVTGKDRREDISLVDRHMRSRFTLRRT